MLEDHPELDALLVPTGGGGLLAGMAVVARALRPELSMVGVQSDRWPSMLAATGRGGPLVGGTTIAEGIAVPVAGSLTAPIVDALVEEIVTVTDESVEAAINLLLEIEKVVVEGAGAAGIAALIEHTDLPRGRHGGVLLPGGHPAPRVHARVIMRGPVRPGRLHRLHTANPCQPGGTTQ